MPDGVGSGTVLAFDFGLRRIGIALGETLLGQARPLMVIDAESNDARFKVIEGLIADWQPALLVVGLPCSVDGSEHEMTARCRRFAHQLEGRFRLPVLFVDERFSSSEADARLAEDGLDWRARKLQDYFDAYPKPILHP